MMSATRFLHSFFYAVLVCVAQGCEPQVQTAPSRLQTNDTLRGIVADAGLEFPDGRTLDLGSGWENAEVHCQFRIRNVCDNTVSFRKSVTTTCGCTGGALSNSTLSPGESTILELTIALPSTAGSRKRYMATVHRELDDGKLASIEFGVDVVTNAAWYSVPENLACRLTEGNSRQISLNVFGSEERKSRITAATSTIPGAVVTFGSQPLNPLDSQEVCCDIPADAPEGNYEIIVEADDDLLRMRRIPVRLERRGMVDVLPPSVVLRKDPQSTQSIGKISVIFPQSASAIECTVPDGLSYAIDASRDFEGGQRISVVNLWYEGESAKLVDSKLVVTIQLPDGTTIHRDVPLRVKE